MASDNITRDVSMAFVRLHILHHAAKERVYGLWMIGELRHHGYSIGPGTLYPILHSMEASRWLKAEYEVVQGKRRKYYVATARGRRALMDARKKVHELVGEVLK